MVNKLRKNNRLTGLTGEKAAVEYLENVGYEILETNYRYGRLGEIDIIARENEYLCFVEVKTRNNLLFGLPSEAVDWKKQNKIRQMALLYTKMHKLENGKIRFDVVEVLLDKAGKPTVNLIRNAFGG